MSKYLTSLTLLTISCICIICCLPTGFLAAPTERTLDMDTIVLNVPVWNLSGIYKRIFGPKAQSETGAAETPAKTDYKEPAEGNLPETETLDVQFDPYKLAMAEYLAYQRWLLSQRPTLWPAGLGRQYDWRPLQYSYAQLVPNLLPQYHQLHNYQSL